MLQGFFLADVLVCLDCLHQLRTNIEDWSQRGERILEDHADAIASDTGHFLIRKPKELAAIEFHGAFYLGVFRQQAHDGHGGYGLTGAGFADDAQGAAGVQVKADTAHCRDGSSFRGEADA